MRKHILILTLVAFALVAVVGVVGPAAGRGPKSLEWWSEKPPMERTFTGVVERTDHGLSLFTSDGHEYILTGKDLSSEVGNQVTVTGKLWKTVGGKPALAATSFTLCNYC